MLNESLGGISAALCEAPALPGPRGGPPGHSGFRAR
jgi:hypothetical protein